MPDGDIYLELLTDTSGPGELDVTLACAALDTDLARAELDVTLACAALDVTAEIVR